MEPRIDNAATMRTPTTTTDLPLKPGSWALDKAHARSASRCATSGSRRCAALRRRRR